MTNSGQPGTMEISTKEQVLHDQINVLKEPVRLNIHNALSRPRTLAQVAKKLGLKRDSLYYHLRILEKAGLVDEYERRQVRNLSEVVYIAKDLVRLPDDDKPIKENTQAMRALIGREISDIAEEVRHAIEKEPCFNVGIKRISLRLSVKNLKKTIPLIMELRKEFLEKVEQFDEEDGDMEFCQATILYELIQDEQE